MPDDAARARAQLVEHLVRDGRARTAAVRRALEAVPRHLFLPGCPVQAAYADEPVVIKSEGGVTVSSVSQPSMVAIMLEQLAAEPGHRVLEIGAGAGWNAALLAHVVGPGGAVTTVDIDDDLVVGARANLRAAGFDDVAAVVGDGALGHPDGAPYDRIELTVGSTDLRAEWVDQLVPGGRLLLPLTVRGSQLSVALDRTGPDRLDAVSVRSCAFVRLRGAGSGPVAAPDLDTPGWSVQLAEPDARATAVLDRGLSAPGRTLLEVSAPGSPADVWDGLGLWCALADPSVFRLLATEEGAGTPLGRSLFRVGGGRVTVGLAGADGFALLLADPPGTIRAFGDGDEAAARLAELIDGWAAAGRPHAADLRISAVLHRGDPPVEPGAVVDTPGARLSLRWPYRTGDGRTPVG